MAAYDYPMYRRQSGFIKTFIVVVLLVIIAAGAWLAFDKHKQNNEQKSQPAPTQTSPDTVKDKNGGNGDTQPSSTGTGPGSDNSLLGQ